MVFGKDNKLKSGLENIFFMMFLVFLTAVFVIANIYNWQLINLNYYSKATFVLVTTTVILPLFFSNMKLELTRKQVIILIPIILFMISFLIRYFAVVSIGINSHQVSDYQKAFYYAEPGRSFIGSEYEIFPNWGFYAWTLQLMANVLGYSEWVLILGNVFIQSVSVSLIYYIVYIVTENCRLSVYSALFYMVWPIHIFYNIILSPEHPFIFFSLIAILCIALIAKKVVVSTKAILFLMGVAGISLGLAAMFKSLDKIMLVAVAIILILEFIFHSKNRKKILMDYLKSKKQYIIGAALFLVLYQLVVFSGYKIMDYKVGVPVNRSVLSFFIAMGLNEEMGDTAGNNYHYGDLYKRMTVETNYNYKEVSKAILDDLKEEIKLKKHLNINYFSKKFAVSWLSAAYLYWIVETIDKVSAVVNLDVWGPMWFSLMHLFWIFTVFFCIIATLSIFVKRNRNYLFMFSMLVIFGFAMLSLLVGVQDRYKCVVYPEIAILAGYGYYVIEKLFLKFKKVLVQDNK